MPGQTVVVLGCGAAGVAAALELRRRLPDEHRVLVIDRDRRASIPASYAMVMTGDRRASSISRSRGRLARHGVEFAVADANHVDLTTRHIRAGGREFRYDQLLIATGDETALDEVPGLAESSQSFVTLDAAERLAASLRYFAGGKVLIAAADGWKGPASPYEAAMLLESHFHGRGMRQRVEIVVSTPEPAPMSFAGNEASELITGLLAHKGISLRPFSRLVQVDASQRLVRFDDGGEERFDLLIALPPQRPPALLRDTGLLSEVGRIQVDPDSLETSTTGVFAAGDIASLSPGGGQRTAILAARSGAVAGAAIASRVLGGGAPGDWRAQGRMIIEVGGGAALAIEGDFRGPGPMVVKQPSIMWHWLRMFEQRLWLWRVY